MRILLSQMLQFSAIKNGGVRVTGGTRALSVYTPKPAQADDLLLQCSPEEVPSKGIVSWPGEYDVGGVTLRGIGHEEGQKVSWLAVVDGIRVAFPVVPARDWTDHEIEQLGDIHVLVVVADDAKKTQKLLEEIDPRVLVLLPGAKGLDAEVLKVSGAQGKEIVSDFKLKGMPAEGREVVVLSA